MSTQKEQFKKSSVRIENQDTQSLPKAVTTSQASSPNPPTETTSSPALSNLAPKTNDENSQPYQGKKWEYKLEMALAFGGKFMVGNLDKLGEEGWEAVGVTFDSAHSLTYVLLKREKR